MTDLQAKVAALDKVQKWHERNIQWKDGFVYAPYIPALRPPNVVLIGHKGDQSLDVGMIYMGP